MTLSADDYSDETLAEYGYAYNTLRRLQSSVETVFAQAGVPLPERRFVAVGDVGTQSWDCEQLSFNLIKVYFGTPGAGDTQATSGCALALAGDFVIQLVRCVPGAKATRSGTRMLPPEVEAIEAATLVQAVDAQVLLEAVLATESVQFVKATATPTGAEGGMQAINVELSISLSA